MPRDSSKDMLCSCCGDTATNVLRQLYGAESGIGRHSLSVGELLSEVGPRTQQVQTITGRALQNLNILIVASFI